MLHAEALLLVDDHQAQVLELNIFGEQPMGPDGDIDLAFRQVRHRGFQFLGRRNRLNISTRTGNGWKRRLKVSKC